MVVDIFDTVEEQLVPLIMGGYVEFGRQVQNMYSLSDYMFKAHAVDLPYCGAIRSRNRAVPRLLDLYQAQGGLYLLRWNTLGSSWSAPKDSQATGKCVTCSNKIANPYC